MDAEWLLDLIFPAACAACGTHLLRGTLCAPCRMAIAPHRTAFCGGCGAALPGMRRICHPRVPYILGAAGEYANPALRALIHALKFGGVKHAAGPLADILAHYCAMLPVDLRGFTVIPVPISKERLRERGFNQSSLIARRFAGFFGMPLEERLLVRIAHRTAQSEIDDRAERRRNISGCYAVRRESPWKRGVGKVILIDDVTTSGATFTEAARELQGAGAGKILALALAKAI